MNKAKLNRKNEIQNFIILVVVAVQFILMVYYEWQYYFNIINSDIAADLMLADSMARNQEWILSRDWFWTTELRVLHNQLIQVLLFKFIDNYRIVFVLTFVIVSFLICCASYLLVKEITDDTGAALVSVLLLLVPGGEFYLYTFKVQAHSIYVFFTYAFIYLLILSIKEIHYVKKRNLCIALFCLAFVMGSCGVRFFSLVFLPYLAGELWIFITNNFKKETIVVDKKRLSLCGGITLFAFIGYIFYRFVLEKQYGPVGTTNAILVNGSEAMENLLYTPGALIEIFGGFLYAGEYIISLEGICQIIILLAVLLIYFLFVYSYYCKDLDEDTKYLRRITFISFIINVFLLAFTSLGDDSCNTRTAFL